MNTYLLMRFIDSMTSQDEAGSMASAEALAQSVPPWEGVGAYDDELGDSVWVLREMRLSKQYDVSQLPFAQRCGLAQGLMAAPKEVLVALAKDANAHVRSYLAASRTAPAEALEILASDRSNLSYKIREELVQNWKTPARALEILADMATEKKDFRTFDGIVHHKNVPPSLLARLAQHEDPSVRRLVESPASEDDEEETPW